MFMYNTYTQQKKGALESSEYSVTVPASRLILSRKLGNTLTTLCIKDRIMHISAKMELEKFQEGKVIPKR